jgi:predicted permease
MGYSIIMSSIIFSILSIYLFIVIGFIAKKTFKEQIDAKTITLINVYFLQVFLTFWGLLIRPIDISLIYAPSIYFIIVSIAIAISSLFALRFFKEKKDYSIAMVAAMIGNTSNLGIPLNISIFGEESIPYTTIVNLVNIFIVYTFGVYYYSRGSFDIKTSLLNIVKLPILWAAFIAITLSINGYKPSLEIEKMLMMGAYASITMQLFLFGIYLYDAKLKEVNKKLVVWVISFKFIILPLIALIFLYYIDLSPMIKGIVFMELMMPLAVANVNIASLYDCKPKTVTTLVMITSVMFLGIIFGAIELLNNLGWR